MKQDLIDFAVRDELAGFRLKHLEIYNWGTFHDRIWTLNLNGYNSLLTGDIGSGKSTLVDAVTTLLVPAHRIAYNKAAGAESRERSLRSYVLGFYKSERSETGHSAKPVALRGQNSYSVILGEFQNEGYSQRITLAQVLWQKDMQGQPGRFYVVGDRPMTIAEHFARFGSDLNQLRKRLRAIPGVEIFDTFPPYAALFRRRFGIENEQALDLFLQTVSMKSVGNLTAFVREHMLESADVQPRIDALIGHFDDLSRAHEAVLRAKRQIERLTPIWTDCTKHQKILEQGTHMRSCRDSLRVYFAAHKGELLTRRLKNLQDEQELLSRQIERFSQMRRDNLSSRDQLKQAIAENGGDRIARLKADIEEKTGRKEKCRDRAGRYRQLAQQAELPQAQTLDTLDAFVENRTRIEALLSDLSRQEAGFQNARTEQEVQLQGFKQRHEELCAEIESLRQRKSNIDSKQIGIRRMLCRALEVGEAEMPFAGELIRIKEEERAWEGAAERLLHNFGLSLLVPEHLYAPVAEWVDRTHLSGRLVYFRVRDERAAGALSLHPQSLAAKLAVKPDSEFCGWLEQELGRRFDYACCETLEQFRREQQAITRAGQIKSGGQRHEKDDRHSIDDRSRYVLGWSNEPKIAALTGQAEKLEQTMQGIAGRLSELQQELQRLDARKTALLQLGEFRDFNELDWQSIAQTIADLESEKKALEATSDVLHTLCRQLEELEAAIAENEAALDARKREHAKNEEKQQQGQSQLAECRQTVEEMQETERIRLFEQLDAYRTETLGEHRLSVESCETRERQMRDWLQGKIDAEDKRMKTLEERIIRAMQDYRRDYPLETQETDARLEAAGEYESMLTRLRADDLPRFEQRFKELLNENTIREIANFQSQLNRERQTIKERIERINLSLTDIEYNPGRFIQLEAQLTPDAEIRDFQQQLRACTEGTLTGSEDEQYAEGKFLQVKQIIERFRGREGTSEMDKRWTRKVTDVRNWFVFAASERWREDGSEYEHYTDSGGKSGGQKEKLAYTVLAASLAYQFGLVWGEVRSRSFRFVVIDEAFSRGSDESTRYALELFRKLNLQLLIVTPLQKIHIIEPYVAGVGFVHNQDGRISQLRNLTIEEYRAERAQREVRSA
ncbi:MAG: ATP-dependent exonuclease SbcCD, C subunit-like protein [Desulfobacteraceae bacterium]|nr:MAG: ATP-dependent exonuclease SbcCD, C subunit-like protein [Desulfobacteraceae bacterium]